MITALETTKKVDAHWAAYFGCAAEDLNAPKTKVVPHAALQGYEGALVFRHAEACVVSVPDATPEIERRKLREARPEQAFDPGFLSRVFVVSQDKISGPAWVGIADRSDFRSAKGTARELGDADEEALNVLAEACGEAAWKQSKLLVDLKPMFGLVIGREIVAASAYRTMGVMAYTGVLTHPGHRGKGYARGVASASMEHAFDKGLVPMWRTMHANTSAVGLAKALGFRPYASTYDVKLVEDEF